MCRVSNKIKLCSCATDNVETLKHYWIFHKYDQNRHYDILGELMEPYSTDPEIELYNRELLLQRINEPDAFDVHLKPTNNDRLEICVSAGYHRLTYGFVYQDGIWAEKEYDPFEWMWQHTQKEIGKVKNAIERKNTNE